MQKVILEIKQFSRKFRRPFQNFNSFYLNLKDFEVFYNFFRVNQTLKNFPVASIKN